MQQSMEEMTSFTREMAVLLLLFTGLRALWHVGIPMLLGGERSWPCTLSCWRRGAPHTLHMHALLLCMIMSEHSGVARCSEEERLTCCPPSLLLHCTLLAPTSLPPSRTSSPASRARPPRPTPAAQPFVPLAWELAAVQSLNFLLYWAGGGLGGKRRERLWMLYIYNLVAMFVVGKVRVAASAREEGIREE